MEFALVFLLIFIFWFERNIYRRTITALTTIMVPYIAIVLLNNIIASHFGFYKANDNTMVMIFLGVVFFLLGSFFAQTIFGKYEISFGKNTVTRLNIKLVAHFCAFCLILRIVEIIFLLYKLGINGIMANDYEAMIDKGLTGHLTLAIFPFMPVIFYEWLLDKSGNKKYLFLYIIYIFLMFVETEKVQVLAPVIATFIYCSLKNEKYIKKGVLLLVVFIVVLFVGNYSLKFFLSGTYSEVSRSYYFYRLWNYIAGGIINSNTILNLKLKTNAFDYVSDVIAAFPNMITMRLFNFKFGSDVVSHLPLNDHFLNTTVYRNDYFRQQTNNVFSTLTLMYGNGRIIPYFIVVSIWGTISEIIFMSMHKSKSETARLMCCCYLVYSFLSFFSSYYTIASFVERFIWCFFLCQCFNQNVKYVFKKSFDCEVKGRL